MLSGDSPANALQKESVKDAVYGPQHGLEEIREYYENITTRLILKNSHKLGDFYQLDVVKE